MSEYNFEKQYWSNDAQLTIKNDIAGHFNEKNFLLITGAGFSKNFGYPLWKEFLDYINCESGANIDEAQFSNNGSLDYLKYAQAIREKCSANDFNCYISTSFDPEKCKDPIPNFYENLIKLGFRGFATLNYDLTLELIISQFIVPRPRRILSIDFCGTDRESKVKTFLDNISEKKDGYFNILHLHGVCDSPSNIILTQSDYEEWYEKGSITKLLESVKEITKDLNDESTLEIYGKMIVLEKRIESIYQNNNVLQSLHKKIIWSLFARYRIFFIGFSTDDTFFMNLLNVVIDDFTLPTKPGHYLLISYTPTGDERENVEKERICEKLIKRGVCPIFYPVENYDYERGLKEVIFEIECIKNRIKEDRTVTHTVKRKPKMSLDRSINDISSYTLGLK